MLDLPFFVSGSWMLDLLQESGFSFWLPITKSTPETKKPADGKRWIEGIASTEDMDLQDEIVKQHGIDFSYFLKHGFFNNDHKPGFENKVGQPTECRVTAKGLYVKGFLFQNHKEADSIWELILALEASGSNRKVGFSIQGKVLRRTGKTIIKCWIQDIAITAAPINTNTWLEVVKSLNALPVEWWAADDAKSISITPDMVYKAHREERGSCQESSGGKCCGACNCSGGGRDQKKAIRSLTQEEMDLQKRNESAKAFAATGASGRAITVQSLEGRMSDLRYGHSDPEHVRKSLPEAMSFGESVAWLMVERKLTQPQAQIVAKAVFRMNGLTN